MLFLDDLIGHEDRHSKNVMFSWKNPAGSRAADNLQIHAIDNGYSLADVDAKRDRQDIVLQRSNILPFKPEVYEESLKKMSPELHEKFKALKLEDVLRVAIGNGVKEKGALRALAVRLRSLQDNPEILGKFIEQASPRPLLKQKKHQEGRRDWHWKAAKDPEGLFRDHTSLNPTQTLQDIDDQIEAALASSTS
jgi:hypothetical protein